METAGGGWTVIQNRRDGSVDFNRTWQEYREGFGSPQGEHWLGNAALHALTSAGQHQLRIELEDWHQQKRHATYNNFRVASEAQRWDTLRRQMAGVQFLNLTHSNELWYFTSTASAWLVVCVRLFNVYPTSPVHT